MSGYDRLWNWFGLSRSSFITIPRSLAHEMPDEWQNKMAELLEEWDDEHFMFNWEVDGCSVICKKDGKFCKTPRYMTNYRHPDKEDILSRKYK